MDSAFVRNSDELWKETEEWRRGWIHQNPCKNWLEHERAHGFGFCQHYAGARYRVFRAKIDMLFKV